MAIEYSIDAAKLSRKGYSFYYTLSLKKEILSTIFDQNLQYPHQDEHISAQICMIFMFNLTFLNMADYDEDEV